MLLLASNSATIYLCLNLNAINGICLITKNYCFEQGIIGDLSHYFCNLDGRYEDYVAICRVIKKQIRQNQIEGGLVGIYNPSITQRLNNLAENVKQENVNVNVLTNDPLSDASDNGTT